MNITNRLQKLEARFAELETVISLPETVKNKQRYKELMIEYNGLRPVVEASAALAKLEAEEADLDHLLSETKDADMRRLAEEERRTLAERKAGLLEEIKVLLLPKDPLDLKNIIMEIRAGTGGEEAALFAADLFRMYQKYVEGRGWRVEVLSGHGTGIGGFKEIIFSVEGKSVYENLRYESGVHRVQRVPVTEAGGRIHTSAVTVAVLPEAEETDIDIRQEDLRIDVFRSGGPGGQSVNTTDSAVRVTHLPSGLVVICQDEKSQHKNKAKALRVLRARLFELEEQRKEAERREKRRSQVGSGDRSERIRTYNFPQNRLTDHRINLTLYKLDRVMEGDLAEVVEALKLGARESLLSRESSSP
ncbi:MAG: peptide chain release factor 1 [Spirochaetales bacterium]|nr:peptide chain release factor 1 [Spirochaetales bacterium]